MEEISVTVTTGRKNSINILRKLSHPVCHVKGEDPRGHGVAPSRKKLITGLATVAFLASVVVIRLVQIATTSSLVEGDMLWKGFPLYLAINGLICLVLMVALYLLLCWKEDANQRRWILKDNFSLTLGQSSKKVHFDAAISLKWNKKQKPDGVPEGPHFTKFLSNLLETLDTKLTQVSKNMSSSNELDVYMAAVRLWSISPPCEGDPELRSKWVYLLNDMAAFLEERNRTR